MDRDLYYVLGVPSTASEAEIRRAFWGLAKKYHPDVSGADPVAARTFIEVTNAAETLLDPRRRASYDKSRVPATSARPATARPAPAAPKPPPPPPPRTSQAAATPPEGPAGPARKRPIDIIRSVATAIGIIGFVYGMGWGLPHSPRQNADGIPDNGTVVWRATHYVLDDGWGINLAGNGARIQIVPGTSTDLEVTGGDLSSAGGFIAILRPGEALTYQHCVSAVQRASSQSEALSEIAPGSRGSLCASGGGGDLASIQVTRDDGASLVINITVWEYV